MTRLQSSDRLLHSWPELNCFKTAGICLPSNRSIQLNSSSISNTLTTLSIPFTFSETGIRITTDIIYSSRKTLKDVVLYRVTRETVTSEAVPQRPPAAFNQYSFSTFKAVDSTADLVIDLSLYNRFDRFSQLRSFITHLDLTFESTIELGSLDKFGRLSTLTLRPAAQQRVNIFFTPHNWRDELEAILLSSPIKTIHFVERRPMLTRPYQPYLAEHTCLGGTGRSFRATMNSLGIEWDLTCEDGTVIELKD